MEERKQNPKLIKCSENYLDYGVDVIGGKGINLLRLYELFKKTNLFNVPKFFIIPSAIQFNDNEETKKVFDELKKPVIIRSSSPLEDGINASFAGMFLSVPDKYTYDDLKSSSYEIIQSSWSSRVSKYAERMGINLIDDMAIIVQEQVVDPEEKGIIQLEEDKIVMESVDRKGKQKTDIREYDFLDVIKKEGGFKPNLKPHDYLYEFDYYYADECAREAKKQLGLEGVVQIEFCLSPCKLPDFVQIRQLPKTHNISMELDLTVPKGVPYIESRICNGVPGELTLPAYVTFSQAGFDVILIKIGERSMDLERINNFVEKSKLSGNLDFFEFRQLKGFELYKPDDAFSGYKKFWELGNSLFPDYILVCDRLDETILDMNNSTPNKKAIITCNEASKTSHAMTVARDLGIMCMGKFEDIYDYSSFYHNIETGDIIHMKSDGKKAVAYVEKRREKNPYRS